MFPGLKLWFRDINSIYLSLGFYNIMHVFKDIFPPCLVQVVISGRSQWKRETKTCTSVNLTKACKNPEDLGKENSHLYCLPISIIYLHLYSFTKKGFFTFLLFVTVRFYSTIFCFSQTQRWSACS